ncbi:MAG: ribonuclease R [Gammaproteobacteria bacterium]|nr:ribonuclease R [Gammaproteobacteria bacterium]
MVRKKKKKLVDPYAKREASKYESPIASRELILEVLEKSDGPLPLSALHEALQVDSEKVVDALARRLGAMERDGQLIRNRQNHYLPITKVDLVRGRVMGHADGFGFLIPDEGGEDLFLSPFEMRTLMHGDRAVVRPIGKSKRGKLQGKLVEIIERSNKQIVGRYYQESGLGFVVPDNKRLNQDVMIPATDAMNATNGQFVVTAIIEQPNKSRQPIGKVIEVIGDHLAPGMEIDVAIRSYDLPYEWSDEVLQQVEQFSEQSIQQQLKHRKDMRELNFVTIDGLDAKDFDDAVYCESHDNGWKLWVAIADVSHYVETDTALDEEARNRATSVYFPERVIPMLPENLSNGLCSLKPEVDRLCMVCEMFISESGELKRHKFYDAVMCSSARLTYDEVQTILYDKDPEARENRQHLIGDLENLRSVYNALRKQRKKRGAIDFDTKETYFVFDQEKKIKAILPRQRSEAHMIIEECMINANVAAAEYITRCKLPTLFRVHEDPTVEKLRDMREFLESLGIGFSKADKPKPSDYMTVIKKISHRKDKHIIEMMLLRSMAQAVYSPESIGHFGLALPLYAHFTSPIRRYPDLVVHRTIRHLITKQNKDSFPLSQNDLVLLGEHCSMCERRADDATRDVDAWLKCEFMLDKLGQEFSGKITSVTGFGFFVLLDEYFVEGLVHVTALKSDYYHYDEQSHCLFGERSKKRYSLGDEVKIIVARVSLDERKMDFSLVLSDADKASQDKDGKKEGGKYRPGNKTSRSKTGKTKKAKVGAGNVQKVKSKKSKTKKHKTKKHQTRKRKKT